MFFYKITANLEISDYANAYHANVNNNLKHKTQLF